MFRELVRLKNKMDRSQELTAEEYGKAVTEYLDYGRKYYHDVNLTLVELNKLFNHDYKFDGPSARNYYEENDALAFVANSVFDDGHFGSALTESELAYRLELIEDYKAEIAAVKVIIQNNPDFEAMDYKQKINFVANLLSVLRYHRNPDNNEESFAPKF